MSVPNMPVVYSAVKRFGPDSGESWQKYVEWSGLTHLREVVSLDLILCPTVVRDLTDEGGLAAQRPGGLQDHPVPRPRPCPAPGRRGGPGDRPGLDAEPD